MSISRIVLMLALATPPAAVAAHGAAAPPNPYVDRNSCEMECCHWGRWDVGKAFLLRDRPNGRTIAHVPAGGSVTGLRGWTMSHPVRVTANAALDETPIRKGDAFYVLENAGGDLALAWFRGKTYTLSWEDVGKGVDIRDQWWLKVRTSRGVTGFVLFDEQFGGNRGCT